MLPRFKKYTAGKAGQLLGVANRLKSWRPQTPVLQRRDIIGVLLVLMVVSIVFSSYVVWFGTDGIVPKVMLLPQMIFAASVLVWKFTR